VIGPHKYWRSGKLAHGLMAQGLVVRSGALRVFVTFIRDCSLAPFALSLACPELVEGSKGLPGFDRLSPNGQLSIGFFRFMAHHLG
jgi:hypothetical protein